MAKSHRLLRVHKWIFPVLFTLVFLLMPVTGRTEQGRKQESVWDYPRPPAVEETSKQVQVVFGGVVIAETTRAKRVLQKGHPPAYYIPAEDVRMKYLVRSSRTTTCEYKGPAVYYNIQTEAKSVANAAWSYPDPAKGYEEIRDYIAFYPRLMDACYVDGELVIPEADEYFGGWITSEIVGPFASEKDKFD